jgi:HSP20 family protein
MAALPFKPEISISDLQDGVNRLFDHVWHGGVKLGPLDGQEWAPLIDLLEEPDRFVVKAEVPGLDAGDIEVLVTGGLVTLKGYKSDERTEAPDHHYVRAERRGGSFARSVPLTSAVDADKVTATCKKGVLVITLPKVHVTPTKSVRVVVDE